MSLVERVRRSPFWPMVWKEFIQMRRDRFTMVMMIGIPALQLVLFGYAVRTEVRHLPTVVVDDSRTPESRSLIEVLRNTGNFDIVAQLPSRDEMRRWIERGDAHAAVVIPPDFTPRIKRERGTLEQLIVTPIDKTSLMLGKIVPFVVVGYVQMTVILLLGRLLFGIPIRGSLPLLYTLSVTYIVANLALGLFVSTVAKTQAQAMQLSFFFIMPNILLSGFMFPREAMPVPAQWLGLALPLTYFLRVLRGILLKGVGLAEVWRDTLALCAFAALLILLSVKRFSKTIS